MATIVEFALKVRDQMSDAVKAASNQVNNLSRSAQHAQSSVGKIESAFGGLGSVVGKISGLLAVFGAVNYLKGSIEAFNEADQSAAQFEATLKSTKGAVGLTREELLKMSDDLSGKTLFDDDAITGAQYLLLTFTNIKGAVYKDALPAITDIAQKMGGDLKGATIQVGKALNDPIKGISALSKVGVSFSESQKKMIKSLVATGKTAEAQKIILKELGTEFGGSAKAAAEAGTGPWKVLKNRFDNITESIGGLLVKGTSGLMPFLKKLVDKFGEVVAWIDNNKKRIGELFEPLIETGKKLFDVLAKLARSFGFTGDVAHDLELVFGKVNKALEILGPVFDSLIETVGTLIEAGVSLYSSFDDVFKLFANETFGEFLVSRLRELASEGMRVMNTFQGMASLYGAFGKLTKDSVNPFVGPIGGWDNYKKSVDKVLKKFDSGEDNADRVRDGRPSAISERNKAIKDSIDAFYKKHPDKEDSKKTGKDKGSFNLAKITGTSDQKMGSKVGDVAGTHQTTINLTIKELIGIKELTTTSLGGSIKDVENQMKDVLLKVLNDTMATANQR